MKHIGVNIGFKQADGDQQLSDQGANRVNTAFYVPVIRTRTSLANGRITVCARCILRKPTFINVDNGPARGFIGDLVLKGAPCVFVCFGMRQCFFIGYAKFPERQKNRILCHAQTLCPLILVRIGIIENILAQCLEIKLAFPKPLRFTMDVLNPAHHACRTNIKSDCHFRYRQSFFLLH